MYAPLRWAAVRWRWPSLASLGASSWGLFGGGTQPVATTVAVVFLQPASTPRDRQAVVRAGGVTLVLTARRRPFHHIADFTTLGLHPDAFHIVVVKSGYLSPELAAIANPALLALSPGAVDQDIERLPREHLHTPTYPFQQHVTWEPTPVVSARSLHGGQRAGDFFEAGAEPS